MEVSAAFIGLKAQDSSFTRLTVEAGWEFNWSCPLEHLGALSMGDGLLTMWQMGSKGECPKSEHAKTLRRKMQGGFLSTSFLNCTVSLYHISLVKS